MWSAQTYRPPGMAEPRFGWSGDAQLILPLDREQELISAARLLPNTKSSLESIVSPLLELGARHVRYLHQDEFGPTRAERLAALRRLLGQTRSILCHLNTLPEPLRIHLSSRLAFNETFRQLIQEPDRSDVLNPLSMELLYEAAVDVEACLPRAQAVESAKLMTSLAVVARETMEMLRSVDTSAASDLMLDAVCQRPPLPSANAGSADPLMLLGGGMIELSRCLKQTLDRLKRRGGPRTASFAARVGLAAL